MVGCSLPSALSRTSSAIARPCSPSGAPPPAPRPTCRGAHALAPPAISDARVIAQVAGALMRLPCPPSPVRPHPPSPLWPRGGGGGRGKEGAARRMGREGARRRRGWRRGGRVRRARMGKGGIVRAMGEVFLAPEFPGIPTKIH